MGIGLWKVRTEEGREIAKAESEDVGSSGGEDDVAEAKFDALKKADDDNYAAVAQGAMSDILQGFVLGEDGRKEEESRIARRLAIRKQGKKTAANAAASSHQARKRRANARAYESDDEEFVAEACKAEKKAKRGGGPRAGSFAVKLPQEDAALAGATEHSGKKAGPQRSRPNL